MKSGDKFINILGQEYEVLGQVEKETPFGTKLLRWQVKFTATGKETYCSDKHIETGTVFDYSTPEGELAGKEFTKKVKAGIKDFTQAGLEAAKVALEAVRKL